MNDFSKRISEITYRTLFLNTVEYILPLVADYLFTTLIWHNNICNIYSPLLINTLLWKFNRNINTFLPNLYVSTTTSIVPEFQSTQSGTNLDDTVYNITISAIV